MVKAALHMRSHAILDELMIFFPFLFSFESVVVTTSASARLDSFVYSFKVCRL
jgi:hypothetical protein